MTTPRPPHIAIVGRPNVGKSTLFNRLLGARQAVVSTTRGTTRDRLEGRVEWRGRLLTLVDTGGLEFTRTEGLSASVQRQVRRALSEADGFLFVCDVQDGLVPADTMAMDTLRRTGKPVLLVANKADHQLAIPPDFFSLGASDAAAVSALHGTGTGDLLDALVARFAPPPPAEEEPALSLAIVGRQNVGKSSLFNALLRDERAVVSELPGTTRDAVESRLLIGSTTVSLIDTAGLRHRRKVHDPIDTFSMSRALEAIQRCDVALVVLDAAQGVTSDDRRLLSRLCETGCGIVVLLNKWDLAQAQPGGRGARRRLNEQQLAEAVRRVLPDASAAPVLPVSAKTGFQVTRAVTEALRVARALREGLSDAACLELLKRAWAAHTPPRIRGRAIQLQRARWVPGRPARVELATRPIGALPRSYHHYLLKRLHGSPKLTGVPVRLVVTEASRGGGS
jgi:GTP-binding protein